MLSTESKAMENNPNFEITTSHRFDRNCNGIHGFGGVNVISDYMSLNILSPMASCYGGKIQDRYLLEVPFHKMWH